MSRENLFGVLILFIAAILGVDCRSTFAQEKAPKRNVSFDITLNNHQTGTPIDYNPKSASNLVYIIKRNNARLFSKPDSLSELPYKINYGEIYDILDTAKGYVGIAYYAANEEYSEYFITTTWRWEKVYIPMSDIGPIDSVLIDESDLYISHGIFSNPHRSVDLTDYNRNLMKIELVSNDEFNKAKKNSYCFFEKDTASFPKKNDEISLPFRNGTKKFVDHSNHTDITYIYQYMGHFFDIDYYLVDFKAYPFSEEYLLYNTDNYNDSIILSGRPFVFADKKYLICICGTNDIFAINNVQIYTVENRKISLKFDFYFDNWIAAGRGDDIFVGNDNSLYIPVVHNMVLWNEKKDYNTSCQYIRMSMY